MSAALDPTWRLLDLNNRPVPNGYLYIYTEDGQLAETFLDPRYKTRGANPRRSNIEGKCCNSSSDGCARAVFLKEPGLYTAKTFTENKSPISEFELLVKGDDIVAAAAPVEPAPRRQVKRVRPTASEKGFHLYPFEARSGQNRRQPLYKDERLTIEHASPIILDALGRCAGPVFAPDRLYDLVLTDRDDNELAVWEGVRVLPGGRVSGPARLTAPLSAAI